MTKRKRRVHIGTSGWSYDHWKGPFYPAGASADELLSYYVQYFHSVEINNSFYHLPSEKTLADWRDHVPRDFIFSAKGSRYITHMKKLKDPAETVPKLLERLDVLRDRLGPILFQLPPRWHADPGRLATFLDELPAEHRYAFEFRDQSWYTQEIYDLLSEHNAAFCIYDLDGHQSPEQVTADFVYVRLHGPDGPYQGSYDKRNLNAWAETLKDWSAQKLHVYCYFDNDENGYAAANATTLNQLLAEH